MKRIRLFARVVYLKALLAVLAKLLDFAYAAVESLSSFVYGPANRYECGVESALEDAEIAYRQALTFKERQKLRPWMDRPYPVKHFTGEAAGVKQTGPHTMSISRSW